MDKRFKLIWLLLSLLLYHSMFWKESLGLNLFVFCLYLMAMVPFYHSKVYWTKPLTIVMIGTLLIASGVVIFNSITSRIAFFISFIIYIGMVVQPHIRSVIYAIPTSVVNFILATRIINAELSSEKSEGHKRKIRFGKKIRLWVIPILVLIVFYFIYRGANPIFKTISTEFFNRIGDFLEILFNEISILWVFFMLLGLMILIGVLYNSKYDFFAIKDASSNSWIARIRKPKPQNAIEISKTIKLKDENRVGVYMIGMVNLLLVLVNGIDIYWIWLGYGDFNPDSLSQMVHQGTYLLILSILLSIGIILYFFRGNQNFYSKNSTLKLFSQIWIFQSIILAISVAIRNYHYISYFGLAYKRIGVVIFLVLVVVGLVLLFVKVKHKGSTYFLFKNNSWSIYFMLVIMSLINWDPMIAKYNLTKDYQAEIDVDFLSHLSDKSLHILYQNREKLNDSEYDWLNKRQYWKLQHRIERFMREKENENWLSWNYAETITYNYLKEHYEGSN